MGWLSDMFAGNQSPIPFDILKHLVFIAASGWESITNPL